MSSSHHLVWRKKKSEDVNLTHRLNFSKIVYFFPWKSILSEQTLQTLMKCLTIWIFPVCHSTCWRVSCAQRVRMCPKLPFRLAQDVCIWKHCWSAIFTLCKSHTVKNWYPFLAAREKLVPIRHVPISNTLWKIRIKSIPYSIHAYSSHG